MYHKNISLKTKSGFTLIEVLVSLLIFSIGLIGMAGLVVMSVKTNHTAYLRTQATFLAESMAERMRANPIGVWQVNYNQTIASTGSLGGIDACTTGCGPAAVAARDLVVFTGQLRQLLPAPSAGDFATIACTTRPGAATPPDLSGSPPYDGTCTLTINWHEQTNTADANQTFSWVFQP